MTTKKKLVSQRVFLKRVIRSFLVGIFFLLLWLAIGILGYKFTVPQFDWYDSLLNASMILSGMGPVISEKIVLSHQAKVFASVYAIISGVLFISALAILISPIAHRIFTHFHLEDSDS